MKKLIDRILKWTNTNITNSENLFEDGATAADFKKFENKIGASLPEDVKAFYAILNGEKEDHGFIDGEEFLSLERMEDEWTVWKELHDSGQFDGENSAPNKGIKADWWNPYWIPFTHDGGGNHLCIDLDPAKGGTSGQIIRMWHDEDTRPLHASSFKEWMEEYVKKLESGQYIYDEEYGIVDKDEVE